jgi:hypothetical protein
MWDDYEITDNLQCIGQHFQGPANLIKLIIIHLYSVRGTDT